MTFSRFILITFLPITAIYGRKHLSMTLALALSTAQSPPGGYKATFGKGFSILRNGTE